ncbi:hypothetical protein ASG82_23310 [Mycobacterium sp. Soil538]|nr:hypothetical protein ASG82_23310 [Mycobacterium sp. Soil538]
MPAAVRPYVTAGVALVGASVISVTPIQPVSIAERSITQDYSLTAASSPTCAPGSLSALCGDAAGAAALPTGLPIAALGTDPSLLYVPINLVNMALSIPAWEIQAMDRFADAMIGTGSWQVWGPTNVFGFDEWDPPKLQGLVDMLIPIKPFSSVLGEDLSWWARANLPMNSGCAALPGACPDLGALLGGMFKVSLLDLYQGYTFPAAGEEGSTNPFTGEPVSWAGQTVKLDPFGPMTSMWEYLTAPPTGPETVPLSDYFSVPAKLGKALFDSFYPFVQNSEWFNDEQTGLAPLFRALAPLLCKSCTPGQPVYDNPWLYDNYPPNQEATTEAAPTATLAAATVPEETEANTGSPADREEKSESSHPVKDAVTGLLKKFELAEQTDDAGASATPESADEVAEKPAQPAEPESGTTTETETETETDSTGGAAESAKPTRTGLFGKHRKSDGDETNSVTSIRDKVSKSTDKSTPGGASDRASSDTGSSDKGSGGAE